jgi:hypothetical protein
MTESNETNVPPPLTPLTPVTPEPGPMPTVAPEGVAFRERVASDRGRSTATRVGIITGSALLVLVGVAAAMGASPSPASNPSSGVGADPSAAPAASADPSADPNGTRPDHGGMFGMPGMGLRGGFPGAGIGFHDITITAIDGSTLSLKTDDGWTRTITLTDATTITKGGATIKIGDLAVGDQIALREDRATDGTYTVTGIVVVLPTVAGQISAIDGNTITLTEAGGTKATIHVDSSTTYQLAGGTGSLADLKVGTVIVAEGTQRTDGSLDAAEIHGGFDMSGMRPGFQDKPGFPDGFGGHDDQDPNATAAPSSSAS